MAKGPWTPLATVEYRVTKTEEVLTAIEKTGAATYFYFGERRDLVFVKCPDAPRARALLRASALAGVSVFDE
jgi:hypothetical protein